MSERPRMTDDYAKTVARLLKVGHGNPGERASEASEKRVDDDVT